VSTRLNRTLLALEGICLNLAWVNCLFGGGANDGGVPKSADGHVEKWRWREGNTAAVSASPPWLFGRPAVPNDRDLTRFMNSLPAQVPI
jgi:hypothetical protein